MRASDPNDSHSNINLLNVVIKEVNRSRSSYKTTKRINNGHLYHITYNQNYI